MAADKGGIIEELYRIYGPRYRTYVTVTGMLAAFTMVVASTIVNVAVPDVIGAFGVSQSYVATLLLFTLGSVVAGTAETFDAVVVGRVMQGAAAGR